MVENSPFGLPIGAVTKLTGIPADTIRTWERRYDVVHPGRDGSGRRLYSRAQVERLRSIAALSERGERVSDLAKLTAEQLQERQRVHEPLALRAPAAVSVALIHPTLRAEALSGVSPDGHSRLDVTCSAPDLSLSSEEEVDVLVIDASALDENPERLADVRRSLACQCVVVTYHYISRPLRKALSHPSIRLVQGATDSLSLRRVILEHLTARIAAGAVAPPLPTDTPPSRFTRRQLSELLEVRANLVCECPTHLASLVLALREFEIYSQRCAVESIEDSKLHAELATGSGQARSALEVLLARVCAHDGIDI